MEGWFFVCSVSFFVQAFCSPVYTFYILLGVLLASFLVNISDLIIHQKKKLLIGLLKKFHNNFSMMKNNHFLLLPFFNLRKMAAFKDCR